MSLELGHQENEHRSVGVRAQEITDQLEIRKTIDASISIMREKLLAAIDEKRIPKGTKIDLQYALRSGYLINEIDDGRIEESLKLKDYQVNHSVIGISGETIYAPPALPAPGSVTIVLDTTAGSPTTLIAAANWHWENRPTEVSKTEMPAGWHWKNAAKYYVMALSTSNESKAAIRKSRGKSLEAEAISMPQSFYSDLDKSMPGEKLRAFFGPAGNIVLVRDLGDVFYGKDYQTLEEVETLADRFKYFAPGQREKFVRYHSRNFEG